MPLHRGVYAVGHRRLTQEGVWLAAVLACGDGAVLSHRDAAALHGLGRWNRGPVEISTPSQRPGQPRLRVYQRRALIAADVEVTRRVPVTSLPRTLVDLADVLRRDQLAAALTSAERDHQLDARLLEEAIARTHGRRGNGPARLRAVLAEHAARGLQLTRSELEVALRRLVREQRLPAPRLNVWIAACEVEVDALWPAERLVVEADSWRWHHDRAAFQQDRSKANALQLLGFRVLRFTHDDVVRRPARTAATIRSALSGRSGPER